MNKASNYYPKIGSSPHFKKEEPQPEKKVSMEGLFQFMHLAMLQQSMSLVNSFVTVQAVEFEKNVAEGYRKRLLDNFRGKKIPSLKWLNEKVDKHARAEKRKFLGKMERMRSESAKHIESYLSNLNEENKKSFEKYSMEVGLVALEMVNMDDVTKAKNLIKLYKSGILKNVIEEIEKIKGGEQ